MKTRPWYQKTLWVFGGTLMLGGFSFFMLVYPTGAPTVPWLGLIVAFVGAWVGFSGEIPGKKKRVVRAKQLD